MRVITPVPVDRTFASRPARLLSEVSRLLGVEPDVERGGRAGTVRGDVSRAAALAFPRRGEPSWCFHPLYFVREAVVGRWLDAYDDWSLAPDMSPAVRLVVSRNYRALRSRPASGLVTVNSRYMQLKLHPQPALLVPNGVDPELAEVSTRGDDRLRVVVMGHFFTGRTDWGLLEEILHALTVDEVLVIGHHPRVDAMVARARHAGRRVQQQPATGLTNLADQIGRRTVFAVPHVVSDYTLSQDLMKVYQALAMGMPVCVPNALWPSAVPRDLGYVFERGVRVEDVLTGASRLAMTPDQRRAFAVMHAWERRALQVVEALDAEPA